jgi:hypothetical protein
MKCLSLVLLIGCAFGCNRVGQTAAVGPSAANGSDAYPAKDEVLEYLDGKAMPLALSSPEAKAGSTVTLRRDQIEALEVQSSGTSVNGGPWNSSITFLVNTSNGKYAVRADVLHRRVEDKRAFFGLEFKDIAKQ